ncbi:MAG: hypothetical protein PVH00_05760 [Gemmatimonadota bacterium]|jgi:hypothetical protein
MRLGLCTATLVLLALTPGCDRERALSPSEPLLPEMSVGGGASWTLTAWYWDGDWVPIAAVDGDFLPADLQMGFNAHNWGPDYPAFMAGFDNVTVYGDVDLPQGVIEDFDNGQFGSIWIEGPGACSWWNRGATACVWPSYGMLVADIPAGPNPVDGLFRMVGLGIRDLPLHGEFDVQIGFAVEQGFHSLPEGKANVMLCVGDASSVNMFCSEMDAGFYAAWKGTAGNVPVPVGYDLAHVSTTDTQGKLRITRTRVHRGAVVESVTGTGNYTTAQGDWRTFNFTARRYSDGTVDGQWERIRREDGNAADSKSRGVVTCLTIVGNEAWIGGLTTRGLHSDPPTGVAWRVLDSGAGTPAPDRISAQYTWGMGYPAWYCANTPADPDLNDVRAGAIVVHR